MKIYTKVVIDMETMETEYEESFNYEGPVALCNSGSSSSGGSNYDKDYNKRMAKIAEKQQGMAEEMMGYYRKHGLSLDVAMAESGLELLPYQTAMEKGALQSGLELLPQQTAARSKFLGQATQGVDKEDWMGRASADVAQGFSKARGAMHREAGRTGINPGSERFVAGMSGLAKDEARTSAAAQNIARREAESEEFNRLHDASGLGLGA